MNEVIFGIYGAAGHGREIMPLARQMLLDQGVDIKSLVFVDDRPPAPRVNNQRVLTWEAFLAEPASARQVALAIADGWVREKLAVLLQAANVAPWTVRASNVVQMDDVTVGEGALLSPFVTLTSNIRIGRYFHANYYSHVAHDCHIGDFVTFAPGVRCNGNVVIEDHAYIGTGALIRQGQPGRPLRIGRGAVVGMGAVVTRDVPPGTTVVGNPARPLVK